jgi:hypothetical protein
VEVIDNMVEDMLDMVVLMVRLMPTLAGEHPPLQQYMVSKTYTIPYYGMMVHLLGLGMDTRNTLQLRMQIELYSFHIHHH